MSSITYECHECGKHAQFDPSNTAQMLLDDNKPRPATYVPTCPHCGAQNTVIINE